MKKHLKIVGLLILALVLLLIGGMVMISWGSKDRRAAVEEMCKLPPGTTLEDIIRKGDELGFSRAHAGAFHEIDIFPPGENAFSGKPPTPLNFSEFKSGEIKYGKMVVRPFLRHWCTLEIKDQILVSSRKSSVD